MYTNYLHYELLTFLNLTQNAKIILNIVSMIFEVKFYRLSQFTFSSPPLSLFEIL